MLHILLVILKIAGIILGVLLLLAVLLLGTVLFVPLRYRIEGRCGPEKKEGRLLVTWLGRLIQAEAEVSQEKGFSAAVRAAWRTVLCLPREKDRSGGPGSAKRKGRRKKRGGAQAPPGPLKAAKPVKRDKPAEPGEAEGQGARQPMTEENASGETGEGKTGLAQPMTEENASGETGEAKTGLAQPVAEESESGETGEGKTGLAQPVAEESASADTGESDGKTAVPPPLKSEGREGEASSWEGVSSGGESPLLRLWQRFRRPLAALLRKGRTLLGLLTALPERIRKGKAALERLLQRLERLKDRWGSLQRKLSWYLELAREEETKRLLKAGQGHARFLWRHFGPRSASGFVRFGFPDPSLTGQAAGILYLVFANPGNTVSLYPEFSTETLIGEGELIFEGRIRLIHLVRVGLSLFRNKDLRHFLRRIRKRP